MTESVIAQRKPRRKWGWLFVALFLLQAFMFAGIIGSDLSEIQRARSDARPARSSADIERNLADSAMSFYRVRQLRSEVTLLVVLAGVCSIATLTLALVGLRRRK